MSKDVRVCSFICCDLSSRAAGWVEVPSRALVYATTAEPFDRIDSGYRPRYSIAPNETTGDRLHSHHEEYCLLCCPT